MRPPCSGTGQHRQNMFVNEQGTVKLIDNLNGLMFSWMYCATDSILLPGTQKFEFVRFGGSLVSKRPLAKRRKTVNPLVLLDYRCYVEGGELGTHLPGPVKQCMQHFVSMTAEALQLHYGFPEARIAQVLINRSRAVLPALECAADLLAHGFEWTLKRGHPVNKPGRTYRWQAPCCSVHKTERGIQCRHPWNLSADMPLGDPVRGGPWAQKRPDPGTYDGGKLWLEEP
ncbi:hypothetical protein QJQ45_006097 [Haematococcus lacustris]|nr:hypothetical protein QJQ45_006097 [Haematococcus lacustris]